MNRTIIVRGRSTDHKGEWTTDWSEETKSWRKAWSIVAQTDVTRSECRKWKDGTTTFLDLNGVEEAAERKAAHDVLMGPPRGA